MIMSEIRNYQNAVDVIKTAILQSQARAVKAINQEQLALYYGIGRYVSANSRKKNWGKGAIETISEQLRKELPGLRGFSATSMRNMRTFYEEWRQLESNSSVTTDEIQAISTNSSVATDEFGIYLNLADVDEWGQELFAPSIVLVLFVLSHGNEGKDRNDFLDFFCFLWDLFVATEILFCPTDVIFIVPQK